MIRFDRFGATSGATSSRILDTTRFRVGAQRRNRRGCAADRLRFRWHGTLRQERVRRQFWEEVSPDRAVKWTPPRWIPVDSKVDSQAPGIHPESTQQAAVIAWLFTVSGWTLTGVDSQKNRPDAGDVARCAPQHTKCTERNRKNNDLAVGGESFPVNRSPFAPKKPSPNAFQRRFSTGQAVGRCPSLKPTF